MKTSLFLAVFGVVAGLAFAETSMKKVMSVNARSVFLYARECEDENLHKTFKAGEVWKSRCIIWTCAVTPGGAFNIPVKLECETLKLGKKGKEEAACVPVGSTNLTIRRNGNKYKNCDCVWMFNQLQYHCPVEKESLVGKKAPGKKSGGKKSPPKKPAFKKPAALKKKGPPKKA
ncbi:uncharacterized protein LOC135494923 [Lineus longissimus]|uniref:uncharacterized protein LOC135494923 n=1 Tax=Lineus longissimus TaxID=88925 RepID=UPI002B4D4F60